MRSFRSGSVAHRIARDWIAALVLVGACGLGPTTAATAASDSIVTLTYHASTPMPDRVVSQNEVDDNSERVDQHTTMSPGPLFQTGNYSGMSMDQLLFVAGVAPDKLNSMTVTNAVDQRPIVTLSHDEVVDGFTSNPNPADPPDAQALIVGNRNYYTDRTSGFVFVRPMRGPGDDNQDDSFVSSVGNAGTHRGIDVTFDVADSVLAVDTPVPVPMQPKAKQTVQFSIRNVLLDGVRVVTGLSYTWTFGDGDDVDHRSRPNHTFASDGRWNVRVVVTDSAGNAGSAQVDVQVGAADPDPDAPPGPSASGGTKATGGGIAAKTAAPTGAKKKQKASDRRRAPSPLALATGTGTGTGTGSGSGGGTGGSGSGGGSAGGGAATVQGGSARRGRSRGASPTAKKPKPKASATKRVASGLVGVLIDDTTAGALTAQQVAGQQQAVQAGARASRGNAPTNSWWAWLLQFVVVALVIGLGVLLEFRPLAGYRRLLTS